MASKLEEGGGGGGKALVAGPLRKKNFFFAASLIQKYILHLTIFSANENESLSFISQ